MIFLLFGAGGRGRTDTSLRTRDFESRASAISPHRHIEFKLIFNNMITLIFAMLGYFNIFNFKKQLFLINKNSHLKMWLFLFKIILFLIFYTFQLFPYPNKMLEPRRYEHALKATYKACFVQCPRL